MKECPDDDLRCVNCLCCHCATDCNDCTNEKCEPKIVNHKSI
jgi:hypothetical protein